MKLPRPATFLVALLAAAGLAAPPEAQAAPKPIGHPAQVSAPVKMDVSPALRDIPPIQASVEGKKAPENPFLPKSGRSKPEGVSGPDAALQKGPGSLNMPAPSVNFEGVNNTFGVLPPDTTGDVGPNHFIQWVNLGFAIYNKSGVQVYPASGSALGNTLWAGFGGACQTSNDGDPQVNYDHLADRWVMSQFALPNYPSGPYYQCFAISTTPDPTGSWYRYAYVVSTTKMNDYPHIGVWPDGYYMTVNQFTGGSSWGGLGVFVYERDKMLAGPGRDAGLLRRRSRLRRRAPGRPRRPAAPGRDAGLRRRVGRLRLAGRPDRHAARVGGQGQLGQPGRLDVRDGRHVRRELPGSDG